MLQLQFHWQKSKYVCHFVVNKCTQKLHTLGLEHAQSTHSTQKARDTTKISHWKHCGVV